MGFAEDFEAITGHAPYPWQQRMFDMLVKGDIPDTMDIPTGLGKTSIMHIWMLALTHTRIRGHDHVPTRLVYIVDRRVIVDQASDEADKLRKKIEADNNYRSKIGSLNISKLRGGGGLEDNRKWLEEPHMPAIIIGTIDMIGSRLLFSGYGVGRKVRSFYAGLLGQDSLLVLDETHLSPAMENLLRDVEDISNVKNADRLYPPRILFMSATPHRKGNNIIRLGSDDMHNAVVEDRYRAVKKLELKKIPPQVNVADEIARHAGSKPGRVMIYVKSPKDALKISKNLEKEEREVVVLTGTIRGFERDRLSEKKAYKAFLGKHGGEPSYMVATSAGEVGADFDADHMVCDATTLDSLIQRLGRLNRTGGKDRKATATLIYNGNEKGSAAETVKFLVERNMHDGSPQALSKALEGLGEGDMDRMFASKPKTQPLTKDLLDSWSMTSIYREYRSRPHVRFWLRGDEDKARPDTYVCWREDAKYLKNDDAGDVFDNYRILPKETLREYTDEVYKFLKGKSGQIMVIKDDGQCKKQTTSDVKKEDLYFSTVVLPTDFGGLDKRGFLSPGETSPVRDVADISSNGQDAEGLSGYSRCRVLVEKMDDAQDAIKQIGGLPKVREIGKWLDSSKMKLVYEIDITKPDEDSPDTKIRYYARRIGQQSRTLVEQNLDDHLKDVKEKAADIVKPYSNMPEAVKNAIITAAGYHDKGKENEKWQAWMHVEPNKMPLAKTASRKSPLNMGGFRHELCSTHMLEKMPRDELGDESDLVLHLVASHHGWARPCFRPEARDNKAMNLDGDDQILTRVAERYANLQKRFGAFGLAWLEGLLRGADWSASNNVGKSR